MPTGLLNALRLLAALRGLKDPRLILAEAQDKSPRRPRGPWWPK